MARVTVVIQNLSYRELVNEKLIPDVAIVFNTHYPAILSDKRRFPSWLYKSVKPILGDNSWSYFGMFMDVMVRKIISDIIPVTRGPDSLKLPDDMWSSDRKWNHVARDVAIAVGKNYLPTFDLPDEVFSQNFYAWIGTVVKSVQPMFVNCSTSNIEFETELSISNDDNVIIEGHPDIITINSVIDIKTSSSFAKMAENSYLQVLSYVAILRRLGKQINYMGILMPIQRGMMMIDMSNWDSNPYMDHLFQVVRRLDPRPEDIIQLAIDQDAVLQGIGFTTSRRDPVTRKTVPLNNALKTFIEMCQSGFHPHQGALLGLLAKLGRSSGHQIDESINLGRILPCQLFFSGNMKLKNEPLTDEDIVLSNQIIQNFDMQVFIHAPYTINLSLPITSKDLPNIDLSTITDDFFLDSWVLNMFREYIGVSATIGSKGVIVHVGKGKGLGDSLAIDMMERSLRSVISSATSECPVLLETPVGCGTEVCWRIEDLSNFYNRFTLDEKQYLKICIDTCHVYVAGHCPFEYLTYWISVHGPHSVGLIHFNDSKNIKGRRADGHAIIGKGRIGLDVLGQVADLARFYRIPAVTE